MNETSPVVPRPNVSVGDYDWNKAPEVLFFNAISLVTNAKQDPVVNKALQMVMALKQKEAVIMTQQTMVNLEKKHISKTGYDALFMPETQNANIGKLDKLKREITELKEEHNKQRSDNSPLQQAYDECEKRFMEMFDLLTPQEEETDINSKVFRQSTLLRLLDYYWDLTNTFILQNPPQK